MRYYVEKDRVMDAFIERGSRTIAACRDIKTAEEICYYLNEVDYDRKCERANQVLHASSIN